MRKYKWEKMPMGNSILRKRGWKVSYNPDTEASARLSRFGIINSFPVELFSDKKVSTQETALIIDGKYYILNGDFSKDYESIKSKKEAFQFYKSKEGEFGSAWSTE